MVLQGVIILRISDLIRFFDLAEFWQFKEGFCKLLKSDEHGCFFDTKEQKYLANEVMEWLQDREPRVTVNNDCLVISVDGNDCRLPLGRLAAPARDCWNKHSLTCRWVHHDSFQLFLYLKGAKCWNEHCIVFLEMVSHLLYDSVYHLLRVIGGIARTLCQLCDKIFICHIYKLIVVPYMSNSSESVIFTS